MYYYLFHACAYITYGIHVEKNRIEYNSLFLRPGTSYQ
jgi:hypothetical protein